MSKLYEEAIADARQVRSVAEDSAKRAVIAAVEPRIRDLVERQLLESQLGDDERDDEILTDDSAGAITPPGPDGKVTLDLDALDGCDVGSDANGDEFVLNAESLAALEPIAGVVGSDSIELQTYRLGEEIARFSQNFSRNRGSLVEIKAMISRVKNTYECVQESVKDSTKRRALEDKLEAFNRALGRLTEMSTKRRGSRVNEGDITLKLTGVPDEIDLDGVGVDLIKDDGDGDSDGGDLDLDLDIGDEGDGDEDDGSDGKMGEGRMSDDTVVDIDEGMLRREISKMRSLREDAVPSTKGHAPRGSELDDFGGGADEGDPWLDSDIPRGGDSISVVGEGEDDEVLEVEMDDEVSEDVEECDMPVGESSLRSERRLRETLARRMASLQAQGRRARSVGNGRKLSEARAAFVKAERQLRESNRRTARIRRRIAESSAHAARGSRNAQRNQAGRVVAEERRQIQGKVAQLNLRNAKLAATTRLLQNESLNRQQRAQIVEQLESARSIREVNAMYGALTRRLRAASGTLAESRVHAASASRTTRTAGATLNESAGAARWAKLAGIC